MNTKVDLMGLMKPSAVHYFFGNGFKISTYGGAIGAAVWAVSMCEGISVWTLVALLAALPLGFMLSAMTVWPIVSIVGSRINGAPWKEGDLVHILVGQHEGHVGTIYEIWQSRGQVRVEVSEQATKDVTDVYLFNEVCRANRIW
jgi:hypothetical protein